MYIFCFEDPLHAKAEKREGKEGEASDLTLDCSFPLLLTFSITCSFKACCQQQPESSEVPKPASAVSRILYFVMSKVLTL